ncbi:hypothetical protein I4F81_002921 [Pyropia yezoensis]|uniref:Uncharacterized protein n=1 Tax=Pyropia yezoensis TaxID=2788 RepID=A0ACC3BR50_PYRYE|nr:hypothetical protein I4F81_002921 [Neopyropia yezoensis]
MALDRAARAGRLAWRVASLAAAAAATVAVTAVTGETINSAAESDFDVYRHHPLRAGGDGPEPVLLKWFEVKLNSKLPTQPRTRSTRYLPGGAPYVMSEERYPNEPLNDTAAAGRYAGWDLLKLPYYGADVDDWLRVGLNRDARLCVTLGWQLEEDLSLPGWTRSGVGVAPAGSPVDLNDDMPQPEKAGVFCRDASAGVVTIPRAGLLARGAFGYDLLLGEADGSPPPRPAAPPGRGAVAPNARCPDHLHDLWVTGAHDPDDADTAGKTWQSWHPQVDPIYWCYYGHDHGTAPYFMGGWAPKWHYTAWKNNRQSESHIGFKGYGLRSGGADYYFALHASTSDMRRVHERFHTVTMTAAVAGEVVADINCKGDFGFSFSLNKDFMRDFRRIVVGGAGQKAISDEFEAITYQQRPKRSKRLNVWDGADPPGDTSVDTEDLPRGRYEEWRGGLGLCTQSANLRGLTVDIKDPLTACRDVECAFQSPLTLLATEEDHDKEVFDKNRGVKRTLRFDDVTVGREQCAADGMDDAAGSVFYTNPFCTRVLDGPGPGAVRQVMKPGWAGSINGKFHSAESWYGMYVATDDDDESGGFMSIEDGLGAAN